MTLTDAGPLLALLDADEADHNRCVAALTDVTLPMLYHVACIHRGNVPGGALGRMAGSGDTMAAHR